ncbi:hypothetical protein [Marilutibacter aestuarii]|uniref:Uncharacterized protein n=1 Tax=Marilutibacter aestuarii TaxID=1706195 RepID=A0A508AZC6_9GAMM|nr:hypothetical protein [Lysobacter aestuarii]TQD51242.1 hypothetical protein FKV25_02080 [Lysobacter aestuarii]
MAFTPGGPVPWTVPPDWARPVRESLGWGTNTLRANTTGASFHASLRETPARAFEFEVFDEGLPWRFADALLHSASGQAMLLPVWPDLQLVGPLTSGLGSIACATDGYDFTDDGLVLLWGGVNTWEVLEVATVDPGALVLASPTSQAWPRGTRLYPLRRGRVRNGLQETVRADDKGRRTVRFEVREPCAWPAAMPVATYLGHPVLEWRPDDGADEGGSYNRLMAEVSNGLGDPVEFDLAGVQLRGSSMGWQLWGRADQSAARSRLYAMRGGAVPVWVPSWKQDLRLAAPIGGASTTMTVEWTGYAALGALQPNRRDLRIELRDGTVLYRRITGVADAGATESLFLDAPLGLAVAPGQVRAISYLTLSVGPDSQEIAHYTDADGHAQVSLSFSAVVPDV